MSAMDLARLRPNVGIALFSREGLVWLGRRAHTSGPHNWQFPQGGIDAGEEPLEAALRELREETGVATVRLLARTAGWLSYIFPPDHQGSKISKGWLGQKQIWFAFAFEGEESEIDLGCNEDVEFDAWRWAVLDQAVDHVIDFKREVYGDVAAAFRPLADELRTDRAP